MRNFLRVIAALVRDTFREAFARLVFWAFYTLSTLVIVFFLFLLKIDMVEGARATISVFGQGSNRARDVQDVITIFQAGTATFLYTWGMAIAVFASAGLISCMFEAGRIELLLSKPVGRAHLLLGRYLGTLLVVTLNICYLVVGVWIILGWKAGVWKAAFLWTIPATVFLFAILLSVIVLLSVLFENAALSIMVSFALMVLSPILAQTKLAERLLSAQWSRSLWKALYHFFPKGYDIGKMTLEIVRGRTVESFLPIWSSALFAVVMLGLSLRVFSRKDY